MDLDCLRAGLFLRSALSVSDLGGGTLTDFLESDLRRVLLRSFLDLDLVRERRCAGVSLSLLSSPVLAAGLLRHFDFSSFSHFAALMCFLAAI